jgi:hypothetical protein
VLPLGNTFPALSERSIRPLLAIKDEDERVRGAKYGKEVGTDVPTLGSEHKESTPRPAMHSGLCRPRCLRPRRSRRMFLHYHKSGMTTINKADASLSQRIGFIFTPNE